MPSPLILHKRADALLAARVAGYGLSVAPTCRADRVMFPSAETKQVPLAFPDLLASTQTHAPTAKPAQPITIPSGSRWPSLTYGESA